MLYDENNPCSIEEYGKKMIGKTFREILEHPVCVEKFINDESKFEYGKSHSRKGYKGGMGNLVEECYFGYKANNNPNPDFADAGVELKVTPYKNTSKGLRAKERLVISMIDFFEIVNEDDFRHSHLWQKIHLILLVVYLHNKVKLDSTIDFVQLFTPPSEDLKIIAADYNKIVNKIKAGKAHELSEGDTMYLGACTKASDSSVRRKQPFGNQDAKPRAFSLKQSYMTYVLNEYIVPGKTTYEPIIINGDKDFESYVVDKINKYKGKTIQELSCIFNLQKSKAKNIESMLVFRILGIKGNHAAQFEKAGIVVKTIRINNKGIIKEHMSFPIIKYDELANETWDECSFGNYLRNTKFLFVVYREDSKLQLHLESCLFWNMPYCDIENNVQKVWQKMHDIVKLGKIHLEIDAKGTIHNNFPKAKDNKVCHVRPHARNKMDVMPLPKGTKLNISGVNKDIWIYPDKFTKHCFWLDKKYILHQIALCK